MSTNRGKGDNSGTPIDRTQIAKAIFAAAESMGMANRHHRRV
ncbi:unnamed protein product [marine sediment metagenome]|uniref:Uncharacterized protein n=1 Tax=marine sediment metagenome TaxID=412755 RepID=X1QSZ0_9ZZZZ